MIRDANGRFKAVSWRDALAVVAEVALQVKPGEIVGIAGKLSDAESMMALKDLLNNMGSNNVWCEGTDTISNADLRYKYLMNSSIAGLEKADVFLLVGTQVMNALNSNSFIVCFFPVHFLNVTMSSIQMHCALLPTKLKKFPNKSQKEW